MKRHRLILLAASAAALTACAYDPEQLALLRETPGYAAGYGDGCTTATEADKSFSTKSARDAYAFDNDEGYRAGWRQGYLECRSHDRDANDGGRILGERDEF